MQQAPVDQSVDPNVGASEDQRFDVCIVGAGPAGLAALSAIMEPYSLDDLGADQAERAARTCPPKRPSVCVVDPEPWLHSWRARFAALGINWLRSPAMAHPDGFDAWSLMEFARRKDREAELMPTKADEWKALKGLSTMGSGLWNLPSSQLFLDFCDEVVAKLPHSFVRGKAVSVQGGDGTFQVRTEHGHSIVAGSVVLALGVPGPPAVPPSFAHLPESVAFHTEDCSRLSELRKGHRVLVVGGGLTAVQAAQLASRQGCKVSLCSRRQLVTRDFDIPVEWFDHRIQGRLRHNFWAQPSDDRLCSLRATKGGGSVPPHYMQQLQADGRVEVVHGEAQDIAMSGERVSCILRGQQRQFDRVVFACGHRPNCLALPLVRELQAQWPVPVVGGLPVLTKDLQWGSCRQLFVVGALAGMQVGPDAANLMGSRRAAEVVAKSLGLRLWQRSFRPHDGSLTIRGNRYADLFEAETDDDEATDTESMGSGPSSDSALASGDA